MKKYKVTSPGESHTVRAIDMQDAISFKNTLCPHQVWIIREVLQVKVKKKYSERKLVRSR